MAFVVVKPKEVNADRRKPDEVLGIEGGPSMRGSTFWGRVLHCGFEHYLANILGWTSTRPSDPLDTGVIWHYALEQFYLNARHWQQAWRAQDPNLDGRDPHFLRGHNYDGQLIAYRAIRPFASEPGYEDIHPKLTAMLDAYFARWSHVDPFEVLGVEVTVSSDGRFGFEWSNKLDLLVIDYQLNQPAIRIVEHKSAYRLGADVMLGYTQDLQVMGQVWLYYGGTDGQLYRLLHASGFEHLPFLGSYVNITSKTKNPGCDRVPVPPSGPSLRGWEKAMQSNTDLLDFHAQRNYPKNYAQCSRKYGLCEFFHFCRAFPEAGPEDVAHWGDDQLPPGYKRRLPLI